MSNLPIVDPLYNPLNAGVINQNTPLGPGITMSTFLGSYGNPGNFGFMGDQLNRERVAQQLYLHAQLITAFNYHPGFKDLRLVVVESIGDPGVAGDPSFGTPAYVRNTGRLVVYELRNNRGQIDPEKTFDLAVFWKDHVVYDRIGIWYDIFNPDKSLTCQLMVTLPQVTPSWNWYISPRYELQTYYNGRLNSSSSLVEITG